MVNSIPEQDNKVKRFEDYKPSEPRQLELFLHDNLDERKYSNTIELYDALPKYFVTTKERTLPEAIERLFEFRGKLYELTIKPAVIKSSSGCFMKCYPGEREEIIEDVLRKFACEQKFPFLDDIPSVRFGIRQLRKHLKTIKHNFSHTEIVQALEICVGTTLKIRALDGSESYHTHMFQSLYLATQEETRTTGSEGKNFIRLNELVANSIRRNNFRRLNYECLMSFKNSLARRLYKRLSHLYTYADGLEPENTYSLLLSTILRDFGLRERTRIRDNIRIIKKALDELKEKGVIADYMTEKASNPQTEGDVKFILKSGYWFGSDMKGANQRQKENQIKLATVQ